MNTVSSLSERIAVVTGASGGIGSAISLALAREGARLCLVGRDREKMEAVARHARDDSSNIALYKADLGVDEDIHLLGAKLQNEYGGIDILIHCAGVISVGETGQAPAEAFDRQYRINLRAPFLLTQVLLPMLRRRCGQVVFINSSVGLVAKAGVGQYAATKHGLKAIADSLREEVNADGVRIISVYPGRTASPMQAAVHTVEKKSYIPEKLMQPSDVAEVVLHALSLPRSAEVTDIMVRPMKKP